MFGIAYICFSALSSLYLLFSALVKLNQIQQTKGVGEIRSSRERRRARHREEIREHEDKMKGNRK